MKNYWGRGRRKNYNNKNWDLREAFSVSDSGSDFIKKFLQKIKTKRKGVHKL